MTSVRATILRTGMVTPVGLGSAQTCLAIAAGVPGFEETTVYDKRFSPLTMALFPDAELPELEASVASEPGLTTRQIRMLRLAAPALQEVLDGVRAPEQVPLFLAGATAFPGQGNPTSGSFLELLLRQAKINVQLASSRSFPHGRAAGLLALQAAVGAIQRGEISCAVVGGVDSYLDLYLLATLDMQNRIQTASVLDGFIPGEAAGFLLVGDPAASDEKGLAQVIDIANADEPGHLGSDQPYLGDGLSAVVTHALRCAHDIGPVRAVYASLNGESFGAKEWGVAFLRNRPKFDEDHFMVHPADCIGDAGAATGVVLLCLAAHGVHNRTIGSPCLVWASSDGPHRAAALLAAVCLP